MMWIVKHHRFSVRLPLNCGMKRSDDVTCATCCVYFSFLLLTSCVLLFLLLTLTFEASTLRAILRQQSTKFHAKRHGNEVPV